MKFFKNLFYTRTAKVIMLIVFFVCSCFLAKTQVKYFSLYNEDRESFVNTMLQMDSFDYENSFYYTSTVRSTIENVVMLSMEYSEIFSSDMTDSELLDYYTQIGDATFIRIYESFATLKNMQFAFVNHADKKVYSNIKEINGAPISENILDYFGQYSKTLLVARSCQDPFFATDTFIDYTEHIRSCAEKYEDNFDIYISFGDEASFAEDAKECSELHFAMRQKISKVNDALLMFVLLTVVAGCCIVTVTGRHEAGGKIYLSKVNKLPNDFIFGFYMLVLICIVSLYRTSFFMIVSHRYEQDFFWFSKPDTFYVERLAFCVVAFICFFLHMVCILKRAYKNGTLFKNTFCYTPIMNLIEKLSAYGEKIEESIDPENE